MQGYSPESTLPCRGLCDEAGVEITTVKYNFHLFI